jgi:flagellar hook assembly protein FlgD
MTRLPNIRLHPAARAPVLREEGQRASVSPAVTGIATESITVRPSPLGRDGAVVELVTGSGATSAVASGGAATVVASIRDVRGRLVDTVLLASPGAGMWSGRWDGRDAAGRAVGAGVYFVSAHTPRGAVQAKVLVSR